GGGGGRDGLGDHCTAPLAGVVEQLSESRAQGSPALAAHLAPRAGEALARLRGGRRMTLGQAAHEEQGSRGQLVRRIGRERGEAIARHVGVLVRAELILQTPILRSEEHTSELQSQSNLVCRLLLEKKKKITKVNLVR